MVHERSCQLFEVLSTGFLPNGIFYICATLFGFSALTEIDILKVLLELHVAQGKSCERVVTFY